MTNSEDMPLEPRPPSTKAAERLAVIVDAAERAALSVIDDAEKEASRYLKEAQTRADLIVAERLREAADLLERHRGSAIAAEPRLRPVEPEPSVAEEEEAEPSPESASDSTPDPQVEQKEEEAAPGHSGSAAARLLATQMAVSGASRKEIEMRLKNGFEIEDTGEILDAILGPEE